jgi:hypothetical protein
MELLEDRRICGVPVEADVSPRWWMAVAVGVVPEVRGESGSDFQETIVGSWCHAAVDFEDTAGAQPLHQLVLSNLVVQAVATPRTSGVSR